MSSFDHLGPGIQKENMFGGTGVFRAWPLRNVRRQAPFASAVLCELAAGASVGEVSVEDCSVETLCILRGLAEVNIDGHPTTLQAGQSVDVARHSRLSLANGSREAPVQYLLQKIA
jgi:mannose-6-phosphate isomerase-like protein (cupin superfamily)